MGRCLILTFALSGVLFAGLAYFLYEPLPSDLDNVWQLQYLNARAKVSFIYEGIRTSLGLVEGLDGFRAALYHNFRAPLSHEDKSKLEIYDTKLNEVPVRIYKPKTASGVLPGLVFFHGGGWVVFSVSAYDGICAHIANKANIIVISVEYRLAPEYPFPAGFEDCLQVALYALKSGNSIGIDPTRIAIAGDSAGGNLAAAVSTKLRDDKIKPALKAQLLIYGVYQYCDLGLPGWKILDSYNKAGSSTYVSFLKMYFNLTQSQNDILLSRKFLTKVHQEKCRKYVDYKILPKELIPEDHKQNDYLAPKETEDVKAINSFLLDPRFAPMLVDDLSNLPPSFVLSVGWDRLRDENIIYAERLKKAGNKVQLLYLPDSFHGILNKFPAHYGFANGPKLMNEILTFINKYLK